MTMKAWRLAAPGGLLSLDVVSVPEIKPGAVLVRMLAAPLLGYLGDYLAGKLPYWYPQGPFVPGTNGVGRIEAIGAGVHHLGVGQRVAISPHLVSLEITEEPAQILTGLTGVSADSGPLLAEWANGTLAELVLAPATVVTPLDGLDALPAERLAVLGKFAVPFGGLVRGRLAAGERVVINGGSGYFGSAAVPLALALGAERVVVAGRSIGPLVELATMCGPRVVPVALTGDAETDGKALKAAAGGRGAHLAFDIVGRATDASSTVAALKSLQRGGRLVLMGSMSAPLSFAYGEIMVNNWEVIGNFMYPRDAFKSLAALIRAGLLDPGLVRLSVFPMAELPAAIDRAATMRGLDCTVLTLGG